MGSPDEETLLVCRDGMVPSLRADLVWTSVLSPSKQAFSGCGLAEVSGREEWSRLHVLLLPPLACHALSLTDVQCWGHPRPSPAEICSRLDPKVAVGRSSLICPTLQGRQLFSCPTGPGALRPASISELAAAEGRGVRMQGED